MVQIVIFDGANSNTHHTSTDEELPELNQDSLVPCWILRGVNLSYKLNEYRGNAIAKLRTQTLNASESMALNHVYLFNDNLDYLGLNDVQVAALTENLNRNENYKDIHQQDARFIDHISHTAMIDDVETLKVVAAEDLGSACKKTVHLIVDNLARFDLEKADESVFTMCVIDIKDLEKAGHFTEMKGNSRTKPSVTYSASIRGEAFDVFIVEVKCPNSKESDDLLKLSVELQIMLNRLVQAGIDAPQAFGMMVYGYNCSTFKMDLIAPATYRMIKLKSFFVPRNLYDLSTLHTATASLNQVNLLLKKQVAVMKDALRNHISDSLEWLRLPLINKGS